MFIKLDAGNEEIFKRFNRARGIMFSQTIENIKNVAVSKKIIQTMVCNGQDGNMDQKNLTDYIKCLKKIKPDEVHVYSLLYVPFPHFNISPVPFAQLSKLTQLIMSEVDCKAIAFMNPVKEETPFTF